MTRTVDVGVVMPVHHTIMVPKTSKVSH